MFIYGNQTKKLYINYNCADDYTDETFLEKLRKNISIRKVTFSEAFYGACLLSQQLSLVVIFISCFVYLYNNIITPELMLIYTIVAVFLPYIILFKGSYNFIRIFKFMIIYMTTSFLYAPVFRSLMKSVSTDTVYILSGMLLCLHLLFYDYGVPCLVISPRIPLFLAVFSAVCLISRFISFTSTFTFIHITVLIFAISPVYITRAGLSYKLLFSMIAAAAFSLYIISTTFFSLFIAVIIFVNVICPYYFVKWHSYKDNIYGPWDEAMLNQKHKNYVRKIHE